MEKIITCVILNYNDAETTVSLVKRVKNYTVFNYIIVVDNCSTDNSVDLLKHYEDSRIIVIRAKRNGGYGYGNNIGIKYSYDVLNASYIMIANPDVIFTEQTVVKMKEVLSEKANHTIVAPIALTPQGIPQEIIAWKLTSAKQEVLESSVLYNRLFGLKRIYDNEFLLNNNTCYVDVVQGSLFMLNAEIMVKHGMYDEDFFLYSEEQVIGYKLKEKGFKTILLVNESYIHNHSVSINKSYKSLLRKKKLFLRSKILYFRKYNNLSRIKIYLAKIFFAYVIVEIIIISFIKTLNSMFKNLYLC